MAFYTATVTDFTELLTALRNNCVTEGWTLSGKVLHKGDCYTETDLLNANDGISVRGGTGIDGSNNLTTAGPVKVYAKQIITADTLSFPMTYFLHILTSPDEVYLMVKFGGDKFLYVAFGISPFSDSTLPGTGGWYSGSTAHTGNTNIWLRNNDGGFSSNCPALFYATSTPLTASNSYVHHGLESQQWSTQAITSTTIGSTQGIASVADLQTNQPNTWNGEAVLLPVVVNLQLTGNRYGTVAQMEHARYLRNDNIPNETVIAVGSDSWKVYPHYRRDVANRNGSTSATHTGTMAIAIRYVA